MKTRRGLVAVFGMLALVAAALPARDARACGGAVLRDIDESAAMLVEAESSLESGDLRWARELAKEVAEDDQELFYHRARRIEALAIARDPFASEADLTNAAATLGEMMKVPEQRTPALEADFAEAAARVPQFQADARRQLLSLSDRDLMGSAYAYAALARLADAHADHEVAKGARQRCTTMAVDAAVCGEKLRSPALFRLHGTVAGYAMPMLVAFAALLHRLLRRKKSAPWIGFGARGQAAAIGVAGLVAFLFLSRSPGWGLATTAAVVMTSVILERRLFLRAVRKGKVPGFAIRPADEHDPKATLALHFGPRADETLEEIREDAPEGGYRVQARTTVLRMRGLTRRRTVGSVLAFGVLLMVASSVFAMLGNFGRIGARYSTPVTVQVAPPPVAPPFQPVPPGGS